MFGLAQVSERRQLKAEAERAERAFDAARMQPLEIQQEIARCALQECAAAMKTLSTASCGGKEGSLFRLRFCELELKIHAAMQEAESRELEPAAITTILAQTLLVAVSGARRGDGTETIGENIARWSQNILPDFERLEIQLAH